MLSGIGTTEIIIVALLILLLFGFKKLPDAARSIGKSARVFKSEVNEMKEEDRQREETKKKRQVEDSPSADGHALIDESTPRTDNQSGPVA